MELGIPENTLYGWRMKHREGRLSRDVPHKPATALKLTDELQKLRAENKERKRKAIQLEREREILDKAARFFAQSQKKERRSYVLRLFPSLKGSTTLRDSAHACV